MNRCLLGNASCSFTLHFLCGLDVISSNGPETVAGYSRIGWPSRPFLLIFSFRFLDFSIPFVERLINLRCYVFVELFKALSSPVQLIVFTVIHTATAAADICQCGSRSFNYNYKYNRVYLRTYFAC